MNLLRFVAKVAGKKIKTKGVEGPVGVLSRNFSNARIYSIGWQPKVYLEEGIGLTCPWIEAQVTALAPRVLVATSKNAVKNLQKGEAPC